MNPESIVVGLEQAKALKEAGWPLRENLFAYAVEDKFFKKRSIFLQWNGETYLPWYGESRPDGTYTLFAAPTAEEILRRLPGQWPTSTSMFERLRMEETNRGFVIGYSSQQHIFKNDDWFEADTLANAAAAMWLYLKEQNLLPEHDAS